MFKRFWNVITNIGIQPHYDNKLTKRITLTNQFTLVSLIVYFFAGINHYFLGDQFLFISIEFFVLVSTFGFWLNNKYYHRFATSFLFFTISASLFYFDSYCGIRSGVFLYYFPVILAIGFVYDIRQKSRIAFHFLLLIGLFLINVITHHKLFESPVLTDDDRFEMLIFNCIFSLGSIGFFMYLTITGNLRESELFEQRLNERKAMELAAKEALSEKEILVAEIHHRVKNNLAIITSLLNLQISSVNSKEAKDILLESKNRVKSMALIHDRLYRSDNMGDVDFEKYTTELIDEIQYSYPTSNSIEVNTHISNVKLNVNTAIPCGLILNELLTNCYKYAFEGREEGKIDIHFKSYDNRLHLMVKDNGIGLKKDYKESDSLGMVVIQSLSEQLDGEYQFIVNDGTCFDLKFDQGVLQ